MWGLTVIIMIFGLSANRIKTQTSVNWGFYHIGGKSQQKYTIHSIRTPI